LKRRGVRLLGRALAADGPKMSFADDLLATTSAAQVKMTRILASIDAFIDRVGLAAEVSEKEPVPEITPDTSAQEVDLRAAAIKTVLWATGFRRSYPWLKVPVLDERGELRHDRGVLPAEGLYVLGLRFQCHRNSSFIDGVGRDAEFVAAHIAARLERQVAS
jgi:putative flavoprotein involved in K+ transport